MNVTYFRYVIALVLGIALLVGCASITPEIDPPKISLLSLRSIPVEGESPRFEIQLRVINPNKETLDIAGISYSIELLGRELITGVVNDVSPVVGYGEGIVTLDAGLQLLELFRLMVSLGTTSSEPL